jgi:3-demethylubiquinone-9 3-methyltransferase
VRPGAEGRVKTAGFAIGGQDFLRIDSPVTHGFTFTPAVSIWMGCEHEAEPREALDRLAEGGSILMPIGPRRAHPRIVAAHEPNDAGSIGRLDRFDERHAGVAAAREQQAAREGRGIRKTRVFDVAVRREGEGAHVVGEATGGRVGLHRRRPGE